LGHGVHDLVSKTRYSCFHGPEGVSVDFGEIPSQMLEQWCWEPSQLKSLSLHYSYLGTEMLDIWEKENKGKTRPENQMTDALIEALIRSRRLTFGSLFYLDQLHRGIFDMSIHQLASLEEAEAINLDAIWNKLRKEIQLIDGPEVLGQDYTWGHGYTTFSHLVSNDYDAGYYAYLLLVNFRPRQIAENADI
jgi:metallopeptidase MepB